MRDARASALEQREQRKRERRELKRASKRARRRELEELAAAGRAAKAAANADDEMPVSSADELVSLPDGGDVTPPRAAPASVVLESAHACAQGPRPTMEDEYICEDDVAAGRGGAGAQASLFAVLDGHGGDRAAKIAKRVLLAAVRDRLRSERPAGGGGAASASPRSDAAAADAACDGADRGRETLLFAFSEAEAQVEALARRGNWIDGSTACCALLRGSLLAVANLGDSRAVLGRAGGRALALSVDHKPDDEAEHRRICEAGGLVSLFPGDCARVNGDLALSRAFGDVRWKVPMQETPVLPGRFVLRAPAPRAPAAPAAPGRSIVSATPDVECVRLLPGDDLLLIACDGLWDVMESVDAIAFARARLKRGVGLAQVGKELVRVALARGSMDNVTVVLVRLGPLPPDGALGAASKEAEEAYCALDGISLGAEAAEGSAEGLRALEAFGPALPEGFALEVSAGDGQ